MKRLTSIMVIISMMALSSVAVFAADAQSEFKETYEETEILTHEVFESVSKILSGEALDLNTLIEPVDKLLTNAKTLETLAGEMGKQEAADEAGQMALYLTRIKKAIQTGEEQHSLTTLLARYYLHYNNCVMVNTVCLKDMQHDHVEELKEALEKDDMHEISHLAEHLHVHSDQMYYAAMIFRKKAWQKFSIQAKEIADAIFEAARKGDIAAVRAGVEEIEKPLNVLKEIVQE